MTALIGALRIKAGKEWPSNPDIKTLQRRYSLYRQACDGAINMESCGLV
jgi:acyl-CoA-binding protein